MEAAKSGRLTQTAYNTKKATHHPALRTHKLKGRLAKSWAFSTGYDLRSVFQFEQHEGAEAILLEVAGTHDELY